MVKINSLSKIKKISFLTIIIISIFISGCTLPVGGKPKPMQLPYQTPIIGHFVDDDGVLKAYLAPDYKKGNNIFLIAMQVLEATDESFYKQHISEAQKKKGLIPRLPFPFEGNLALSNYQKVALRWLIENKKPLDSDSVIWYYDFDNNYNDISIKAPWPSAFGQAHVIKAMLFAYKHTNNEEYLNIAIQAANAFSVSIDKGGFRSLLPDGNVFYEEVPIKPSPHILNGHLVSTLSLYEMYNSTNIKKFKDMADAGLKTIEKYLDLYDTGYWSKYDLNPKKGEILFRFNIEGEIVNGIVISIDSIELINNETLEKTLLDVGREDDFDGAYRISGAEWNEAKEDNGRKYRSIIDGRSIRLNPVPKGTLQNSYFVMQLPTLKYSEYTSVPYFELRIKYRDEAKAKVMLEIRDIAHGNYMKFVPLKNAVIEDGGDKKWKVAKVKLAPQDLGWHMGEDYQSYHVELLNKIYNYTGSKVLKKYADKWKQYLINYKEEQSKSINSKDFALLSNGTKVEASSKFYKSPNDVSAVLDGESIEDYAASVEGEWPPWFQLRFKEPIKLTRIEIEWESKANFGKEFTIQAQVNNKLINVVKENNGQALYKYTLPQEINNVSGIKITVNKVVGQQRMLMRGFSVY